MNILRPILATLGGTALIASTGTLAQEPAGKEEASTVALVLSV